MCVVNTCILSYSVRLIICQTFVVLSIDCGILTFTFQHVTRTQSLQCVIDIGTDFSSNPIYAIPLYSSMFVISRSSGGLFQLIKMFKKVIPLQARCGPQDG